MNKSKILGSYEVISEERNERELQVTSSEFYFLKGVFIMTHPISMKDTFS